MLHCGSVPPGSPIIESRDDVVSEGNETELTCTAIGSKPAASIRWMKGEDELTGAWANNIPRFASRVCGLYATKHNRVERCSLLRSLNELNGTHGKSPDVPAASTRR